MKFNAEPFFTLSVWESYLSLIFSLVVYAKIGANAVVLCDVPSGATAAGIPAKIINL